MNTKGEVTDIMQLLLILVILGIGFFILIFVVGRISEGVRATGINTTAEGEQALQGLERIGTSTIDNGFMMLFIGLVISVFITSFLVRTHPIFLFLYILFLAITMILGFYLGNVYYDLQNNPVFSEIIGDETYISLIMNNIVEITVGVAVVSFIIIFAKFSTFGGTQQY